MASTTFEMYNETSTFGAHASTTQRSHDLEATLQSHAEKFQQLNKALEEEQKDVKKKLEMLDLEDELHHAHKIFSGDVRIAHTVPTISDTQTIFSYRQNIIPSETTVMDNEQDFSYKLDTTHQPYSNGRTAPIQARYPDSSPRTTSYLQNASPTSRQLTQNPKVPQTKLYFSSSNDVSPDHTYTRNRNGSAQLTPISHKKFDANSIPRNIMSNESHSSNLLNLTDHSHNESTVLRVINRQDLPLPPSDIIGETLRRTKAPGMHPPPLNSTLKSDFSPIAFYHSTTEKEIQPVSSIATLMRDIKTAGGHMSVLNRSNNSNKSANALLDSAPLSLSGQDLVLRHAEVTIENLGKLMDHPNVAVKRRAAAYIQHLAYRNRSVAAECGAIGIIQKLVSSLELDECRMECIGALTNLTYNNVPNKLIVRDSDGIQEITRCLVTIQDSCTDGFVNFAAYEPICNCLWNLSASHDELGQQIIRYSITYLVRYVLVPFIGTHNRNEELPLPGESDHGMASAIAVLGIMKNISVMGPARRFLREKVDRLIDDLLWIFTMGLKRSDPHGKLVENSACTLRNLVYNLHLEAPNANEYYRQERAALDSAVAPEKKRNGVNIFCLPGKNTDRAEAGKDDDSGVVVPALTSDTHGWLLLPYSVKNFIRAIRESYNNKKTLEACLAVIQNLCSGDWIWASYARTIVLQERALGSICEQVKHPDSLVVASACGCLKNVCKNPRAAALVGEEGIQIVLESRVQDAIPQLERAEKHDLIAFINILNLLIRLTAGGSVDHCTKVANHPGALVTLVSVASEKLHWQTPPTPAMNSSELTHFKTTIVKKCRYLLYMMWYCKAARKSYSRAGYKKQDFVWYTRDGKEQNDQSHNTTVVPITPVQVERPQISEDIAVEGVANPSRNVNNSNNYGAGGTFRMCDTNL